MYERRHREAEGINNERDSSFTSRDGYALGQGLGFELREVPATYAEASGWCAPGAGLERLASLPLLSGSRGRVCPLTATCTPRLRACSWAATSSAFSINGLMSTPCVVSAAFRSLMDMVLECEGALAGASSVRSIQSPIVAAAALPAQGEDPTPSSVSQWRWWQVRDAPCRVIMPGEAPPCPPVRTHAPHTPPRRDDHLGFTSTLHRPRSHTAMAAAEVRAPTPPRLLTAASVAARHDSSTMGRPTPASQPRTCDASRLH